MKRHHDPDTDSLYIDRSGVPGVATREIVDGFDADFDKAGNLVGLGTDGASTKFDFSKIETIALPPISAVA